MAKKIEVQIVGDASSLQRALSGATGGTSKFGGALAALGKVATVGLGAVAVGSVFAGKKMIDLASDAAEVDSKMQVVFGKTLPGLTKNLNTFSEATGASRFQLREQAADMGALLAPLLGTKQAAAGMSEQFVKLATDLGSFNNVPVGDALLAIRSGLVGEAEPLRRFGVLLNEGAVKAEAYRLGLAKVGEVLTEQEKVQARASLIMKQTSLAQGDATRTAGSMANQMKALKNTITDTATELGTRLLPVLLPVLTRFNEFLDGFFKERTISGKLKFVWEGVAEVAGELKTKILDELQLAFFGGERNVVDAGEVDIVVSEPTIKIPWATIGQQIKDGFSSALAPDSLSQDLGDKLMVGLGAVAGRLGEWAKAQPGKIAADFRAALNVADITADLNKWIVQPVIQAGLSVTAPARQIGANLLAGVRGGADAIGPLISQTLTSMVTTITQRIPAAASAATALGVRVVSAVGGALERIGSVVLEKLEGVITSISRTATNAYAMAVGVGSAIVGGIVAGLGGLIGRVSGAIADGVRGAISRAGGILRGSGDFMFTKHAVGQPMAEGIIEGLAETLAGRLPKNLSSTLLTAMGAAGIDKSATDGGTGIGTSLKGGIDTFLEDKLPANLASILGLAFEGVSGMDFSQAGLGVSWTPTTSPVAPPPVALGPSRLADPDAGLTFINYAPINSQQQLDDMVQSAAARLRNSGRLPV